MPSREAYDVDVSTLKHADELYNATSDLFAESNEDDPFHQRESRLRR